MAPQNNQLAVHEQGRWQKHKPIIRRLYEVERKTLPEVKRILETEYGFPVIPLSTYETKLRDEFGLRKKFKKRDWLNIYHRCQQRKEAGKDSAVYLNGVKVPWDKAWKEMRRNRALSVGFDPIQPLRSCISVRTPSPDPSIPSSLRDRIRMGLERLPDLPLFLRGDKSTMASDNPSNYGSMHMARATDNCHLYLFELPYLERDSGLQRQFLPFRIFQRRVFESGIILQKSPSRSSQSEGADNCVVASEKAFYVDSSDESWNQRHGSITVSLDAYETWIPTLFNASNRLLFYGSEIPSRTLPHSFLYRVFQVDCPTIRSAWEDMVENLSWQIRHAKDIKAQDLNLFTLLIKAGLRHPGWRVPRGSRCLGIAARTGSLVLTKDVLALGARCEGKRIIEALEAGHEDCANAMIDDLYANGGRCRPEVFGDFILRWADMSVDFGTETFNRALDRFLERGADLDSSITKEFDRRFLRKQPTAWFYKRSGMLHRGPDAEPWTLLDRIFYLNPDLYIRIVAFSARPTSEITRPGVFMAARQGEEALAQYIEERPGFYSEHFLELILAEYFAFAKVLDWQTIQSMVAFGVDIHTPLLNLGRGNILVTCCLRRLRFGENPQGLHDVEEALQYLLRNGATLHSSQVAVLVPETEGLGYLPFLKRLGVDFRAHGAEALAKAAKKDDFEAVSWLLDAGVDINGEFDDWTDYPLSGVSAISWASTGCSLEMLAFLMQHGARPQRNSKDLTSFFFLKHLLRGSLQDGHLVDKLRLVLDSGIDLENMADSPGSLLEACMDGIEGEKKEEAFSLLFGRGAPLSPGSPLAHWIYRDGGLDLTQKLIEAGASLDTYSLYKPTLTPLQAAAATGKLELVRYLLSKGAPLNQAAGAHRGRTVFQAACEIRIDLESQRRQKIELLKFLLREGADIHAPPGREFGFTAIQAAAAVGDIDTVAFLYDLGADVNSPASKFSYSALDGAARWGRLDTVQFLLNVGALSDNRGRTGYDGAIELAESEDHFAVAKLIQDHAAKEYARFGMDFATLSSLSNLALPFPNPTHTSAYFEMSQELPAEGWVDDAQGGQSSSSSTSMWSQTLAMR